MRTRTVLIVDDDPEKLDALVRDMNRLRGGAVGVRSGEEAVALVERNPRDFQFAVVDQDLGSGIDGIETTKRLVDLSHDLYVLVYTGVPSDDPEAIAKFKYEALAAGAYRYLERGSASQAPKQIQDFVAEMDQLRRLRDWIREYYDTRATVRPSLLTQLDIGVDIIDYSFKLWYISDKMRGITGLTGGDLPRRPCSVWHDYQFAPCLGCLVQRTFTGEGALHHRFLSPLPWRDKNRLFYLNVWTQPIRDDSGQILRAADGQPLAVMESVQDLTDTEQLRQMPRDDRLRLIAGALRDCSVRDRHHDPRCFNKVRLYLWDNASQSFVLKAAEGFGISPSLDVPVHVDASGLLAVAEDHMRCEDYGYWFSAERRSDPLSPREPFIYWPIIEDERTVAVLEAIGGRCSKDTVPLLRPYAEEVRAALRDARSEAGAPGAFVETAMAEVDLKLQTVTSTVEALQLLVNECCRLTGSTTPVLRYRDGNEAVLLVLGLSDYELVAESRYPLSHVASWSVRTMVSGQEQLARMSEDRAEIEKSRKHLRKAGQAALANMQSLCFDALFLQGRCIGSIGFHAEADDNFTREKCEIVRSVARRIALALHDYLLEERTRKQVEEAQDEVIDLVLHNINSPLGTLRTVIQGIRDKVAKNALDQDDLGRRGGRLEEQAARIGRVRDEYLKLRQPWESRLETVDLIQFLQEAANEETASRSDVSVEQSLGGELIDVRVDSAALRVCLRVLLQNSLDELRPSRSGNQISLSLRRASPAEARTIRTTDPVLAIDVTDNGSGVPVEVAKDLFKVVKSSKAKGLGMGLTYARHVVRSAHGDVCFHPDFTSGARFTILLPFMESKPKKGGLR
jgi:signal transduction histidine kinase/ActR/RegA family two-component response regulator